MMRVQIQPAWLRVAIFLMCIGHSIACFVVNPESYSFNIVGGKALICSNCVGANVISCDSVICIGDGVCENIYLSFGAKYVFCSAPTTATTPACKSLVLVGSICLHCVDKGCDGFGPGYHSIGGRSCDIAPSAVPSAPPSVSVMPSAIPSVSSMPSAKPSLSEIPSDVPSFRPSLTPTSQTVEAGQKKDVKPWLPVLFPFVLTGAFITSWLLCLIH